MIAEILLILLPGAAAAALHCKLFRSTFRKRGFWLWLVYGVMIGICFYLLRWIWTNEPLGFLGENFHTNRDFALYGSVAVLLAGVLPVGRYLLADNRSTGTKT